MSVGDSFREGFEMMVQEMGETIIIHKNYGTPAHTSSEVRGLKNNEKGRPRDVMFQFLEDPGVVAGDVLQQKGSRDLWRVTEVHDDVIGDVYQHFEAKVQNMGAAPRETARPQGHNIVIHGDVHGGLQVGSHGSVQTNTVHVSHIENDLRQLRQVFEKSDLSPLDKEEAEVTMKRVEELAAKPKSPDVLAKISGKVDELKKLAAGTAALTTQAAPLLQDLWHHAQAMFQ